MLGLIDWIVVSIFGAFCVLDFFIHPRKFPKMRAWRTRGLIAFVIYFFVAGYSPFLWDGLLGRYTLLDASVLPFWVQVVGGFLAVQLFYYAYHRTMHSVGFLFRHSHQTHHSLERVDVWGAFYFHPIDMLGFTLMGSLALIGLFGVAAEPASVIVVAANFCTIFQHSSVKTPRWLGYIVTRPESHSVHHQRGLHTDNFGDIPLFDMIFGTFRNPETWNEEAGFYDGASEKFWDLLIGRQVS